MKNKNELDYKQLKMTCDPSIFKFETTENLESIKKIHEYQAIYEPQMSKKEIRELYKGWKTAIKATRMFK